MFLCGARNCVRPSTSSLRKFSSAKTGSVAANTSIRQTSSTTIFFTDYDIEEFVYSPEIALALRQRAAGQRFIDMLEAFDKTVGPELLPEVVIDHPKWVEIRHAARQFLDLLNCPK